MINALASSIIQDKLFQEDIADFDVDLPEPPFDMKDFGVPFDYYSASFFSKNPYTSLTEFITKELYELYDSDEYQVEVVNSNFDTKLCPLCIGLCTLASKRGSTLICHNCYGRGYIETFTSPDVAIFDVKVAVKSPVEFVQFSLKID